ncbi:XRE family transcriptional regulator [Puniceibacterium confluentis]|uniref:XRE family transcriptional regulator n=1 Tax=Puniceibacterium confluentis TaxID=1958944 RepID=UPI0011B58BDE|nr:XRE family transcriptional regulator [Puniceibacterium confluentis]
MPTKGHPHEQSRLAKYINRRVLELAPKKAQRDIALEAGFRNPNMVSMVKSGSAKLALDRVPAMAKALEVDPKFLFVLALEQTGFETTRAAVGDIFAAVVTDNEADWIEELRDASDGTDPRLNRRARSALRGLFGK